MDSFCVLTPSFNSGSYLQQCLDSVSACRHVSRHIVFDGGSNDGTVDLLREHQRRDPRLIWTSGPDDGQSDALNKGLALVDTEFFGWLNADDVYESQALDQAFESLSAQEDLSRTAILYGDYRLINGDGTTIGYRKQPSFRYTDCLYSYLTVLNSSALFNTAIAKQTGGFDVALRFAMDYDLVIRMARVGAVHHSGLCLSSFRRHDDAKTSKLQSVYRREIALLRERYATLPREIHRVAEVVSRCRVIARMALEGCLLSRLRERVRWQAAAS